VVLPELKGLRHLRHLVARPSVDVAALTLSDLAAGHGGGGVAGSDAGEILDEAAVTAYRTRLGEIDAEIDEAAAWADPGRRERAELEREALLRELAAGTGLGGRHRRSGSTDERARMAVRKAIVAAVQRIERHDPPLARLLRDTVHTGLSCRYEPDPDRPITWLLDPPSR
jgi:hypothetical protein